MQQKVSGGSIKTSKTCVSCLTVFYRPKNAPTASVAYQCVTGHCVSIMAVHAGEFYLLSPTLRSIPPTPTMSYTEIRKIDKNIMISAISD